MAVFPVILDSCVLYPMYLRDTLFRAAQAGLYRPHWSQEILDGALRNLVRKGKMTAKQATRLENNIKSAFPDAMLEVPKTLLPCMDNHPNDHHVLAAALIAKAQVIVTDNLKHFPPSSLKQFQIDAKSADDFLTDLYDLFSNEMHKALQRQVAPMNNPPMSVADLLAILAKPAPTFVSRFL